MKRYPYDPDNDPVPPAIDLARMECPICGGDTERDDPYPGRDFPGECEPSEPGGWRCDHCEIWIEDESEVWCVLDGTAIPSHYDRGQCVRPEVCGFKEPAPTTPTPPA